MNWNGTGIRLGRVLITEFTTSIQNPETYEFTLGIPKEPLRIADVSLNLKTSDIEYRNKPYDFKEIIKSNLTIEELFKIINKKISE